MLTLMRTPPADRANLGQAARTRIQRSFNMDNKADEWERLYRSFLNQAR
jgi:hypothetical protein